MARERTERKFRLFCLNEMPQKNFFNKRHRIKANSNKALKCPNGSISKREKNSLTKSTKSFISNTENYPRQFSTIVYSSHWTIFYSQHDRENPSSPHLRQHRQKSQHLLRALSQFLPQGWENGYNKYGMTENFSFLRGIVPNFCQKKVLFNTSVNCSEPTKSSFFRDVKVLLLSFQTLPYCITFK